MRKEGLGIRDWREHGLAGGLARRVRRVTKSRLQIENCKLKGPARPEPSTVYPPALAAVGCAAGMGSGSIRSGAAGMAPGAPGEPLSTDPAR